MLSFFCHFYSHPQIPAYVMVPLIGACIPVTINSLYERLTNVFRDMCDRESELLQIDKINNHTKKCSLPIPPPLLKQSVFKNTKAEMQQRLYEAGSMTDCNWLSLGQC